MVLALPSAGPLGPSRSRYPEETMRIALVLTTLLCFATVAQAQQANLELPAETPVPTASVEMTAEMDNTELELAPVDVEAQNTVTGESSAAIAQPTQTSWWWLIGAIVVALVIAAVLL
jgi:hypothetical protein